MGLLAKAASVLVLALAAAGVATAAPEVSFSKRVQPCMACHSEAGSELGEDYVPILHGKPAGYLFNQLVNYREARRTNTAMLNMVGTLSDDYLWDMATYFAEKPLVHKAPAKPEISVERLNSGRELVRVGDASRDVPACAACHGEQLTGVEPNTPGLVGLPRHYILAQLGAWREGARHAASPDCMQTIAQRLTPDDIEAVASWLAAQPVPEDAAPRAQAIAAPPMECGSVAIPARE